MYIRIVRETYRSDYALLFFYKKIIGVRYKGNFSLDIGGVILKISSHKMGLFSCIFKNK